MEDSAATLPDLKPLQIARDNIYVSVKKTEDVKPEEEIFLCDTEEELTMTAEEERLIDQTYPEIDPLRIEDDTSTQESAHNTEEVDIYADLSN